jgi:serine/threonine protein phosphatase 1
MFSRIDADLAANPSQRPIEVYLGDYVDRGPASRAVLDLLVDRCYSRECVCLKGNHELVFRDFLQNSSVLINPSDEQLAELRTALDEAMPAQHRWFLDHLRPSFSCGDYLFVHAGVRPGVPLAEQREEDLLWIREEFLLSEQDFGQTVIHGHTPVTDPDIRFNRINIDTGAYATGRLTCLILEEDQGWFT